MSASDFPSLNLRLERHAVLPIGTEANGELLSCRSSICVHDQVQSSGFLSVFDFLFEKSFHLRHHNDEIKSLFGYHNPTIVQMTMAFNAPAAAGVSYRVQVRHAMIPNATPDARIAADLTIDSINPQGTMRGQGYTVEGDSVVFAFDAHFGAKMVVTVAAVADGKTLKEEAARVTAPHGDLFVPVPLFIEPFNYKNDSTTNLLTFPAEGTYKVKKFHSAASVQDLVLSFYEGSVLQARYYRLYFHRDVPVLRHMTMGDLPLIDFVQKFTLQYPVETGDEALFHYYSDEERLCIEQMNTTEDIMVLVSTENAEFRRWLHIVPNLASPEGEQAILSALRDRYPVVAATLLAEAEVVGYSGEEGCEVMLLSTQANPTVHLQVISRDEASGQYTVVRQVTANENTLLRDIVEEGRGVCLMPPGPSPVADLNLTCKEAGISWSSSFACLLHGDDVHSLVFGGDVNQKHFYSHVRDFAWNTVWAVDADTIATVQSGMFNISVKWGEQSVRLPAAPQLPVFWVKYFLAGKVGVAIGQQRLMHDGQSCDDRHTLLSYGIANNGVMELAVRVRANVAQR